jgi:hypothetical protein
MSTSARVLPSARYSISLRPLHATRSQCTRASLTDLRVCAARRLRVTAVTAAHAAAPAVGTAAPSTTRTAVGRVAVVGLAAPRAHRRRCTRRRSCHPRHAPPSHAGSLAHALGRADGVPLGTRRATCGDPTQFERPPLRQSARQCNLHRRAAVCQISQRWRDARAGAVWRHALPRGGRDTRTAARAVLRVGTPTSAPGARQGSPAPRAPRVGS